MSTLPKPDDPEADPRVKRVFDDIRATRQVEELNHLWHYLAFDADLLENTWREVKEVMAGDSPIDAKTREMIYVAVSIANACSYCVHSHTAAARAKGMTDEEYAALLRIVMLAGKTNHLLNALQIPVDPGFDRD